MPGRAWPRCPNCGADNVTVLNESTPNADTTDATLECQACEQVFKETLDKRDEIPVDAVVSQGEESHSTTVHVPPGEPLRVGDELFDDEHRLLITGLEDEQGRRPDRLDPEKLGAVWCKVFDTVSVDVAVNQGHKTWTGELTVKPEDTFYVGDRLMIKDREVAVHAIKTEEDIYHEGQQQARDVVRLYAKAVTGEPITYSEVHRTEIHRSRKASEVEEESA